MIPIPAPLLDYTAQVVQCFTQVALEPLGAIPSRNSCIMQTRITVEVLQRLGIHARPVTTAFAIQFPPPISYVFVSGFDGEERERMRREAANWIDRTASSKRETWNGHMLTFAEGWLIDTTLDQAAAPDLDVELEPNILSFYVGDMDLTGRELQLSVRFEGGPGKEMAADIRYFPRPMDGWQDAPAWQLDPFMELLIEVLVERIKEAL